MKKESWGTSCFVTVLSQSSVKATQTVTRGSTVRSHVGAVLCAGSALGTCRHILLSCYLMPPRIPRKQAHCFPTSKPTGGAQGSTDGGGGACPQVQLSGGLEERGLIAVGLFFVFVLGVFVSLFGFG